VRRVAHEEKCLLLAPENEGAVTSLSFDKYEKGIPGITPREIPQQAEYITDMISIERWDCDILQEEGERVRVIGVEMCFTLMVHHISIYYTLLIFADSRMLLYYWYYRNARS
jgi:hypothetical protein